MDDQKKVVFIALGIVVILALLIVGYYFLIYKKPGPASGEQAAGAKAPAVKEEPAAGAGEDLIPLPSLSLDQSDEIARRLIQELTAHPRLGAWLRSENIIRKFVAAVDNIANGLSPKAQVDFFLPGRDFKAVQRGGKWYIDTISYDRYNILADVFVSLDTRASIRLYRSLKPLLQEAYKEMGYPDADFQDTLVRAAEELLDTPVVDGRVEVERKILSYVMKDPLLEGLSAAQKQFLRMGPDSVQVIQTKLREMALALGVPDSRLPKPRLYVPGSGKF